MDHLLVAVNLSCAHLHCDYLHAVTANTGAWPGIAHPTICMGSIPIEEAEHP